MADRKYRTVVLLTKEEREAVDALAGSRYHGILSIAVRDALAVGIHVLADKATEGRASPEEALTAFCKRRK